eukprot:scaffold224452_cov18-Tisochrysis_lutea.AAC.1
MPEAGAACAVISTAGDAGADGGVFEGELSWKENLSEGSGSSPRGPSCTKDAPEERNMSCNCCHWSRFVKSMLQGGSPCGPSCTKDASEERNMSCSCEEHAPERQPLRALLHR